MKKHPGFAGAVKHLMSHGYSKDSANKIIGFNKAHSSAAAKRKNPRLNRKSNYKK